MDKTGKIIEYFQLLRKNNRLGSSYLFIGNDFSPVKDIIKLINCKQTGSFCGECWDCRMLSKNNHPDFMFIGPDPLTIKIEQIREVRKFLSLKSFRLEKKVVFVNEADTLSAQAANAFLKTLEEPPRNSFIAVCTSKLEGLLPTIISRCRKIFLPFSQEEGEFFPLPVISDFLKGVNLKFKNRREFASFLWTLVVFFRDGMVREVGAVNNRLLKKEEYEIIVKPYPLEQIEAILEAILGVYSVYTSVNENLSLNLIRTQVNK